MRLQTKQIITIITLFAFVPVQTVYAQNNYHVYKTQTCDSLGNISIRIQNQLQGTKIWGDEGLVSSLVKLNKLKDRNSLPENRELKIPSQWLRSKDLVQDGNVVLPPYVFKNVSPYIVENCYFQESQQAKQLIESMKKKSVAVQPIVVMKPLRLIASEAASMVATSTPVVEEAALPAPIVVQKPAAPVVATSTPETTGFMPNSLFGFRASSAANRVYATDNGTGVEATFVSKNHIYYALDWEQIWSSSFSTYALIGQRTENYADNEGASSLINTSTTYTDMRLGLNYLAGEKNKLSFAAGTNAITYFVEAPIPMVSEW